MLGYFEWFLSKLYCNVIEIYEIEIYMDTLTFYFILIYGFHEILSVILICVITSKLVPWLMNVI